MAEHTLHAVVVICSFCSVMSMSEIMLVTKLVSLIIEAGHPLVADALTMVNIERVAAARTCEDVLVFKYFHFQMPLVFKQIYLRLQTH